MTMISVQSQSSLFWISGPYISFLNRCLHLDVLKISQFPIIEMVTFLYLFFSLCIPYTNQVSKSATCELSQTHSFSFPFLPYPRVFKVMRFKSYEYFSQPYFPFHSYCCYPGSGAVHLYLDRWSNS